MILNPNKLNALFNIKQKDITLPISFTFSIFSPHVGNITKDLTSNACKSLLFMKIKPFNIGETIKVMGYEGRVEKLNIFYTTIKRKDRSIVCIPTCNMLNTVIEILK
ncbi:hypothetical protein COBT_001111 [Conglomerata obtusa]